MDKLLDLLNEFDPYINGDGEHMDNIWFFAYLGQSAVYDRDKAESIIISRKYKFIEWLVKEGKIDYSKLKVNYIYHDTEWNLVQEVLMQLAIDEEPLKFLNSILK